MMPTVTLAGWERGLKKVSLSKLLQKEAGKGLAEAKALTDGLLQGRPVVVQFEDSASASAFAEEARKLGAKVIQAN